MTHRHLHLADIIGADLSSRWKGRQHQLSQFLASVGLTGNEHSQSLYIFPKIVPNPTQFLGQLRTQVGDEEPWVLLTGKTNGQSTVVAFPANETVRIGSSKTIERRAILALFIEIHSRLISWWLVNAWRSQQLANATWSLGDSMQIIPAAACARSLVETAASFWIETNNLRRLWIETKKNFAADGPNFQHWHDLTLQLYKMVWAAKFDSKVPDLEKAYGKIPRMNILTQIEKLAAVSTDPVLKDYQWLCNVVHPSIGGMFTFQAPIMAHQTKTCEFQWVCATPISIKKLEVGYGIKDAAPVQSGSTSEPEFRETTIQEALARAATLAVDVLEKTLDDALKIVDDIGLTTKAPTMANFDYWRNISPCQGNTLCPCRSGRKSKHCLHRWTDSTPTVADHF